MAASLDESVRRLEAALGLLEAAVTRRLDSDRRRGDLETELQIMQDDRARLAVDLDGTVARLHRVEAAANDVGRRVQRAAGLIREVLGQANGAAS
jgi:hypothetical protein